MLHIPRSQRGKSARCLSIESEFAPASSCAIRLRYKLATRPSHRWLQSRRSALQAAANVPLSRFVNEHGVRVEFRAPNDVAQELLPAAYAQLREAPELADHKRSGDGAKSTAYALGGTP
jgi:hypothetical protein